jgi:hypothetical protein
MVEASAQATIGELHQRNADLMRALEDYKVQQSTMTHDLDVARQYVSKVHDETEARISENVLEQISSLTNEVVKWKSLAEHSRASAEGSPPAADPARSSLKVVREFTIHSAQSSNEDPSSNPATRVTRGRSPPAAAHRQVPTRKSTSRARGDRDRIQQSAAVIPRVLSTADPYVRKCVQAYEKRITDLDKTSRAQHIMKAQRRERSVGFVDSPKRGSPPAAAVPTVLSTADP